MQDFVCTFLFGGVKYCWSRPKWNGCGWGMLPCMFLREMYLLVGVGEGGTCNPDIILYNLFFVCVGVGRGFPCCHSTLSWVSGRYPDLQALHLCQVSDVLYPHCAVKAYTCLGGRCVSSSCTYICHVSDNWNPIICWIIFSIIQHLTGDNWYSLFSYLK